MRRVASLLFCAGGAVGQFPACTDCVDGVVMGGADVVAYFGLSAGDKGVMGSKQNSLDHGGYKYYFANKSTAEEFSKTPEKYIPAWGGF